MFNYRDHFYRKLIKHIIIEIPNKLEYKIVLYYKVLLRYKTVFFWYNFSADKYVALQDSVL